MPARISPVAGERWWRCQIDPQAPGDDVGCGGVVDRQNAIVGSIVETEGEIRAQMPTRAPRQLALDAYNPNDRTTPLR